MTNRETILTALRLATDWLTGERLAEQLGISRMAVSKQVATLNGMGYRIESAHRKGYRFHSAPDLLLPEEIRFQLQTERFGQEEIHYFGELPSTNTAAKEAALSGCPEGTLFIAEHQTNGRGRRGRTWLAEASHGLCFSLLLRPVFSPRQLTLLPLLAAVAVSEAIENVSGIRAEVKWPNDLIIGGKKICGILTEAGFDLESIDYVVLGIGLNINTPAQAFPLELREIATSLAMETGAPLDRRVLARAILDCFERRYTQACAEGFDAVLDAWCERSCTLGRTVTIRQETGTLQGRAEAITPEGALVLRLPNGSSQAVVSGDLIQSSGKGLKV
ncbi:MAG: biotin--[acetyl-CoA-carboxylase] ligase [Kiritimatiellae bacterium]|nr:biotin--[acetyl-CoA-carboxylase] ligase [Kiritimatiellia bacterium]MDD4735783.1 biotin--[acetyl-CoA-carboxylase] ligase [Kiritimatiellia bacterium]